MAYEHKPGQGTLGKAKQKTKDTSPDLTGKIKLMDGQEYWISAWVKKSSNGGEFYSLAHWPTRATGAGGLLGCPPVVHANPLAQCVEQA
jgi:hypothetical protein